ncbi:glucagon-like peptide 2 receptor isoform X2 [Struthio camelus]|uniref:glucagon-like peptide 2 receptor isoform X2 n=1 Tax=Struthio camelus TaxID=8801 RepID=UPI00051E3085|nr:PREDICTED: glucagon-like peptide 2 receptor [Struthio camelus australis]
MGMATLFSLCSSMGFWSKISPGPASSVMMLFLVKQAKGSLLEKTTSRWLSYKKECLKMLQESAVVTGIHCNGTFDQFVCWPYSPPGNVSVPCPSYLPWLENGSAGNVYRVCLDQGIWQTRENSTDIWRDSSECSEKNHFKQNEEEHTLLTTLQLLYTVGYYFSLISLVLALLILSLLRKLHCTRNYIHMNLFASFILRATAVLIKDTVFYNTYSKRPNNETGWISYFSSEILIICRTAQFFMHYFVGANYFWLLVEGIYLHTLLVTAVLSERRLLQTYIVIGWVVPILFVGPWGMSRSKLENTGCWGTNEHMGIWWIIRGPMLFSIAVNFGIFLKILKLLISKLKAQQMSFHDYKYRLARSTLVLIPLLGIHEFVFTFITDEQVEGLSRHIRLFIQLTMSSFHGFFVAVLYCFANGEVKAELQKQWSRFLLADPFGCKLCFLGENIKYLRKCSQKQKNQHLSSNTFCRKVSEPWSVQLQQVLVKNRTDLCPESGCALPSCPRVSISDSSEEVTTGETTEEVFEESEI